MIFVKRVKAKRAVISETLDFLQQRGRLGCEGFVLWVGKLSTDEIEFTIEQILIPNQTGYRLESGLLVRIDGDELHRINVWLFKNNMRLLAQVHSHPSDAYHSDLDDELPIATEVGCLSIVIPHFGTKGFDLETTAVYKLSAEGTWDELGIQELNTLIEIL